MVAEQASSEMGEVVDEFVSTVGTLTTEAAIVEAAEIVQDEIEAIWLEAKGQINDIKLEYPVELNDVANDAKSVIQQARLNARSDIKALEASAIQGLSSPTTNVATTTPTTSTSTTVPPTSTTSTTTPGAGGIPPVGGPPPGTNNPTTIPQTDFFGEASLVNDIANALTVPTTPDLDELAISTNSAMKAMGAETTLAMAQRLEVFLPPAIAEFVLSPLLIFEVLLRTAIDGGSKILLPLGLLFASVVAMTLLQHRSGVQAHPENMGLESPKTSTETA